MHGMRHFYASIALASGVSVKELAEYLGHHDPGYTLRIYTHLVPSSHRRAREAADGIFKPRRTRAARLENPETAGQPQNLQIHRSDPIWPTCARI
ncbi:hypothetical protein ACWEVP_46255 [Amycolatopsis sp. NPDC003865]